MSSLQTPDFRRGIINNPEMVKPIDPSTNIELYPIDEAFMPSRPMDPATQFTQKPPMAEDRMRFHQDRNVQVAAAAAASQKPISKTPVWQKVLLSQLGLAGLSTAATATLLYVVNPPITQFKRQDPSTSEKQDWRKVLFVCFLVLVAVFIMPEVLTLAHIFTKK